jgi:hypothetical protein
MALCSICNASPSWGDEMALDQAMIDNPAFFSQGPICPLCHEMLACYSQTAAQAALLGVSQRQVLQDLIGRYKALLNNLE